MRRYQYTQLWHELKELAFISKNIQAMAALKIIHQKKGQKKKNLVWMTVMQNQRLHHSFNSFSKIAEEKKKSSSKQLFF